MNSFISNRLRGDIHDERQLWALVLSVPFLIQPLRYANIDVFIDVNL